MSIRINNPNFQSTNLIRFHVLAIDASGSMCENVYDSDQTKEDVVKGVLKEMFEELKKLPEKDSTRVLMVVFNDSIEPSDFTEIDNLSPPEYESDGGTHLYETVCWIRKHLLEINQEWKIEKGKSVIFNVIFLSDGIDCSNGRFSIVDATEAVDQMREKLNVSLQFYDIGGSASIVSKQMGFEAKEINNTKSSIREAGKTMSRNLYESSMSGITIESLSKNLLSEGSFAAQEYADAMRNAVTGDPLSDYSDLFEYDDV